MAVYKDGKRGTWYCSFHYTDWTGKNCRKLKRGFKTRRDAVEWEQSYRNQQSSNLDIKFKDFVEVYKKNLGPKIREHTWQSKNQIIDTKILQYFGEKKVSDIKSTDIIQWQNEMLKAKNPEGNPYKPTYLRSIQTQLTAIFNHAMRFYDLRSNPVKKAGPLGKGKADEMDFWVKEEYLKFIEQIKDKPYSYHAFQILYWCGLREGELLALTPSDIDFEKKVIKVTKSYQRLNNKEVITPPKTAKSIRNVSMPDFLCDELKDFINRIYGLFPTDRIFHYTKSYLHKEMTRGAAKAGVKRITIHDLRHSHISLLINKGFSAVAIANRVGHESVDITYRYAHMFPSEQVQMAAMLNNEFMEDK